MSGPLTANPEEHYGPQADRLMFERGTDGPIGDQFDNSLHYHLTTPFCQTSRRSRTLNSSVMAPEHNSDITMSAAYMLA